MKEGERERERGGGERERERGREREREGGGGDSDQRSYRIQATSTQTPVSDTTHPQPNLADTSISETAEWPIACHPSQTPVSHSRTFAGLSGAVLTYS